jgi:3-(3-hydroxy-phenyl)propionate hydroxylase
MEQFDATVIIAGAGPVGLSLAAALTQKGVATLVLEALPELSAEARASTFHAPTLEMFAEWGVIDRVLPLGRRIERLQYWERATRQLVADFSYDLIAADTPYPFRFQCPQSLVTRCLLPRVEASGCGQVLFNHEVTGASDEGDCAAVTVQTPAGERTFRAQYVVGADGSRSRVRESLGLSFTGLTYEDRYLLVSTDLDLQPFFPAMGPVAYIFDPNEWVIVMRLPDTLRVIFRLTTDEDAAEAQIETNLRERINRFLSAAPDYKIAGRWIYSVHQRIAERFRTGRVALAGDAAHINNPTGGMGMNSGIHDAHHLAGALLQVLAGGADALLDEYAAIRRRVAQEMVQQTTDKNYKDLTATEQGEREQRNRELYAAAQDPALARAYLLRASMLAERI